MLRPILNNVTKYQVTKNSFTVDFLLLHEYSKRVKGKDTPSS